MTIAGSDSGGNAGVQADLRAFHYYGRHGCTVFAALTAQNPFGVSAIHAVPADFVAAQLDAVLGVYDIGAVKTGMLADPAAIEVIADRLAKHPEIAKVIEEAGGSAVAVHARTREQFYSGNADWNVIKKVKESVGIPVVGNGDVVTRDDYLRMK